MTGTVKALEWNPFRAETPFGYYHIDDQTDLSPEELKGRLPFLLSGSRLDLSRHPTLADARAVAQADYERRILSALTASASEPASDLIRQARDWISDNIREGDTAGFALLGKLASPVPASEPEPVAEKPDAVDRLLGFILSDDTPIGPEDKDNLRLFQEATEAAQLRVARSSLHGPYGYLIKPHGLNEEHWMLAAEPSSSLEETSVPLFAEEEQSLGFTIPVPTPDGAVEALRRAKLTMVRYHRAGLGDDVFHSDLTDALRVVDAALETPWQKPGRAAQAQAGEKPDFPADEQSGETSHGVTDARVEAAAKAVYDALPFYGLDGRPVPLTWEEYAKANPGLAKLKRKQAHTALSAALSHPADGWRDMRSAPGDEETPVLLWIAGQYAVGLTWKRRDGTIVGKASMFGNSTADAWKPLPAAPAAKPEGE